MSAGPGSGAGPQLPRAPVCGRRWRRHRLFALVYARLSRASEAGGIGEHRRALLAGLGGRVIEVGCGNGLNFAHYPAQCEVVAVEPEPYLRSRAVVAATRPGVAAAVRVLGGRAEALPVADSTFDAAVVSLVLCSVTSPAASLGEVRRVLRPGGRLHFYEHVQASSSGLRRLQRLAAPLWGALAGGCNPGRDLVAAISQAGLTIEHLERFDYQHGPAVPLALVSPHVLGTARAPGGRPGHGT